jgi:hypothetical protein
MSTSGIVAIFLGLLIICSRGQLLLVPAFTLRWFGEMIKTKVRTRIMGAFVVLMALPMIWSGMSENTGLASFLFIVGVFFLLIAVPALVLFPNIYMDIAESMLPEDLGGSLFGWRIMGLVGVIIGIAIFRVGMAAL